MFRLYQPSGKQLPKELTSYDFVKTYAVLLMIVDHAGYYFYPDELWLRVIGRLCVPVWFFLIGYARSRDVSKRLWIGLGILVVANIITGAGIFPLNIMATMLFIRFVIDRIMGSALRNYEVLFGLGFLFFFLALPTSFAFEYGTVGLLFAMFGWFMRNPDRISYTVKGVVGAFVLLFCVGSFWLFQVYVFGFSQPQSATLLAGLAAVCLALYFFRPQIYPRLTKWTPPPFTWLLQLLGRRTLEIYVAHLLLFKFWTILAGDERYEWFKFKIFIDG